MNILPSKNKKFDIDLILVPLCLIMALIAIWAFTGQWPHTDNPYNSYALQAESWLKGQLHLLNGELYTYLELAVFENKYFVSFPPFPSYVLLPFVAILGVAKSPDHWLAFASYLIAGVYAVKLYKSLRGKDDKGAIFFSLFLLLGNNVITTSMNGWVWFIAQNFAFTLSLAALYYATQKKGGLSLALWACAVGCRPMQILYLPLLLLIIWRELKTEQTDITILSIAKKKWYWAIPTAIIALSYMVLNFLRFGSITEFGHNYLPEFTRTKEGQFDFSYLKTNLERMFRLPKAGENGTWDFYFSDGVCLFLVSPILIAFILALIIAIYKKTDNILAIMLPLLMLVHIFSIIMHRTLGGSHFGNRYFNDLLPFVYYGLLVFMPKKEWFAKICYPLCILGMALNIIGTVLYYRQYFS